MSFNDLNDKQKEQATKYGYHGLFAERETSQEAYDYARKVIDAIPEDCRLHVTTAVQVVINTLAVERVKERTSSLKFSFPVERVNDNQAILQVMYGGEKIFSGSISVPKNLDIDNKTNMESLLDSAMHEFDDKVMMAAQEYIDLAEELLGDD